MVRPPAVAGQFYPSDPAELGRQIDSFCSPQSGAAGRLRMPAISCVVPHAGYLYSGHVAGAVYSSMEIPAQSILLGPRHFPLGQPMAILTEGAFRTPFGDAPIDAALAAQLAHADPTLREDPVAHQREHSLEVQIPFLQRLVENFRFVPVVLVSDRYGALERLGQAVARVVGASSHPVLMVASSDMNHYENETITRAKDARAIERILALDPRGLYDVVRNEGITMCGYGATVAMLVAALELGAKETKLIRYATSAEVNGDRDRVVGYAGIVIS